MAYTPVSLSQDSPLAGRRRVFSTAQGSRLEPFGWVEWALLCGVALIWGSSFLLIEIGLESLEPATITWVRVTLGFLVLTVLPAARQPVQRADHGRIVLLGFIWVVVPFLLFPIAQQHIDSALAGMLNASVPILSAAVAVVLLRSLPRHAPSCRHSARVRRHDLHRPARGGRLPRRRLGGAPGGGSHRLLRVLAVPLQQRYGAPAVMCRALGLAAVATAPFGLAGLADSRWDAGPVLAVTVLGVVGTGAAFVLMAALVGRAGATRGGVAIYFIPIVAMVLGITFRSEVIHPLQWAGTAVVLFGAWLTSRREDAITPDPTRHEPPPAHGAQQPGPG